MKEITCPKCGEKFKVLGNGRKPSALNVTNVCDALQSYHSVPLAADKLGCSRALVYKILKENELKAREVIGG